MKTAARSVVFDTDPGMGFPWADVDDNLALLLALSQQSISVDLISIVCGNVAAEDGVRSISRTLSLARKEVPVTIGARSPLVRPYQSGRSILEEVGKQRGTRLPPDLVGQRVPPQRDAAVAVVALDRPHRPTP